MLFGANDFSSKVEQILLENSDRTHVDACRCDFDRMTGEFKARFISERFAVLTLTKHLSRPVPLISEEDLTIMAEYATAELERLLNEMGSMAMFNLSAGEPVPAVPEGMTCEVVIEEEVALQDEQQALYPTAEAV